MRCYLPVAESTDFISVYHMKERHFAFVSGSTRG
jgi:hypothetical protein